MSDIETQEINATRRWAISIIVTLFIQTGGFVWYLSSLNSQVSSNTDSIASLQVQFDESAAVIIGREQLEDILGVRDERIDNIEKTTTRIEAKLDRLSR